MNDSLATAITDLTRAGAAPGCTVTMLSSGTSQQTFSTGHFGESDSPKVSSKTVYDVASITKLFTTALVLRLHEAGKLSIHDKCATYLDNFQKSELRLIDLLTHRANFPIRLSDYRHKYPARDSLYATLMTLQPPREASDHIEYANLEFFYLGVIVEKVAGCSLQQLMSELFQDLNLHETYVALDITRLGIITPPTEVVDGQVIQGIVHDETARILGGLAGHAGVFSTTEDLAKFGQAWLGNSIIESDQLRRVVFRDYDPTGRAPQAIGWWLRLSTPNGGTRATPGIFSHTGFTGPLLAIRPSTDGVCAFACNRTYYGRDNTKHCAVKKLLIDWLYGSDTIKTAATSSRLSSKS